MTKVEFGDKEDLFYLFRELFARGKITREELDKCIRQIAGCPIGIRFG